MAKTDFTNNAPAPSSWKEVAATFATAIWCGEVIIAVLVASRRFAGAIPPPESALLAVLAAGCFVVVSLFCCAIAASTRSSRKSLTAGMSVILLTAVPPLVLGLALLPSDSSAGISALLTMCAFAVFGAVVLNGGMAGILRDGIGTAGAFPESPQQAEPPATTLTEEVTDEVEWNPPHLAEPQSNVSQWMSRTSAEDGSSETVEGVVAVDFAAGQKTAIVHLSFLPPLASIPEIECEPQDAADVRLRTAAVQTYGARIEARRSESVESPVRIEIAYAACAVVHRERAA